MNVDGITTGYQLEPVNSMKMEKCTKRDLFADHE